MYHVSAQGVDEHMINVHYYYYYNHAGTVDGGLCFAVRTPESCCFCLWCVNFLLSVTPTAAVVVVVVVFVFRCLVD